MMCGTPAAPARESRTAPAHAADPETLRFLRAIISRPATFTFVFIVANVFVYLLMALWGGAHDELLLAFGAKRNDLIQAGQWWRFVTPVFLHVQIQSLGPMHLLVNMYGLFMLGPYVEKLYGSARFVVFWILTGVAGVAASYLAVRPEWARGALGQFLFKPYDSASAGASGALFGLMGVLFVFGIKYREELPEGLKRAFGTGLLPTLVVNLFIGYVARGFIDNAAHLGGLVSGMGLALLFAYKRPGARGAVAHAWHAAQAACLALVVVSFVMVGRHFDAPPPSLSKITQGWRDAGGRTPTNRYVEAINEGQNAFIRFRNGEDGGLAPAVEKLEAAPSLSPDADSLRDDLGALLASAREAADDGALKGPAREQRVKLLSKEFGAWQDRFAQWVEGEGRGTLNMQKPGPPADAGRAEEKK
jgi:membrane associated rhomboid family serine protease